ncbi:MAG: tetratricopeptide repeat protein, partial [Candidatus Gracilibacteria bacterium]|nr:tetratricopeptide repeat protein [Candidatus Gracilibacteria bacterium]
SKAQYDKALDNYEKALKIKLKTLGENNPYTATSYNNIGAVYQSKAQYDKALENYEKALIILKNTLGVNHPYVRIVKNNIKKLKNM